MSEMEFIKQKQKEKKELLEKLKGLNRELRLVKVKLFKIENVLWEAKEKLGKKKGEKCPALKPVKDKFYNVYDWTCLMKDLKKLYHSREKLYCTVCYRCKLTRSQIKTGLVFRKIEKGNNYGHELP